MSDPKALEGQRIEQYVIRKHIARGGMADVYLAYEEELRRKVALKVMLPALVADQQYVVRFQREARTVAQLDHANIVHIYAIGLAQDGRPFIAMQYIEGGSLRDTLERVKQQGRLVETNQSLTIIGKMADALAVAHAAGIVHRDIKPSNILIRPDGRPVLVDLGIAAVEGSAKITHTGTLIGTPHYMSPEQASGKRVDARSDLYSLGVILYELLAGRRPFEAVEPMAVLHQHIYEQPPALETIRPDLSQQTIYLVQRCLRKDPNERFQTAAELRSAIDHVIQAEGGEGMVTQAGVWIPHPTDEYRLSDSKIMTPQVDTPPPPPAKKSSGSKWLLGLIPLLILGCLLLTWLMISSPSSPFYLFAPPTATIVTVAGQGDVFEGEPPTTPPTEEIPTATAEVPATEAVPAVIEETAVPAHTSTPEPAATAEPTAAPPPTDAPTPAPTATIDLGPEWHVLGESVLGSPIELVRFGAGPRHILFVGGLHAGAAPSTVSLAIRAINHFTDNPQQVPDSVTLYVIPNANPDSPYDPGELSGRLNANNVDLNRNWDCRWKEDATWRGQVVQGSGGLAPFSEPETQVLKDAVLGMLPEVVVFWEARAKDGLSSPGTCGSRPKVSLLPAEVYGIAAGYPIADFEDLTNQVLNGDSTNWIDDQGIPAIAVLLPEYENVDWNNNLAGMRAIIDHYE